MYPWIFAFCSVCAGWFFMTVCWWLERADRKEAESQLARWREQYYFLLDQLPDPEPWQLERRKKAAAHKAAEPAGYHYPAEGRNGTEA